MKARNKHTGELCEVHWQMCDFGRKCQATDKPYNANIPCIDYNAVVDDYEFDVNGNWVDGLEYVKNHNKYIDYRPLKTKVVYITGKKSIWQRIGDYFRNKH